MYINNDKKEFNPLMELILKDKHIIKVLEFLIKPNNSSINQKHWKRPSEFINLLINRFKYNETALYRTLGLLTETKLVDKLTIHRTDKRYRISRLGLATYFKLTEIQDLRQIPFREIETYLVKKGIYNLTSAQKKFLDFFYEYPDENILLFASPGTGKTWMTLCYIIHRLRCEPEAKCLYLTPFKALNHEKYLDFNKNLKGFSIRCFDSDNPHYPVEEQIVIATYEKAYQAWLTRIPWIEKVRIIVADELTLICEPRRGLLVYLFLNSLKESEEIQLITSSSFMGDLNSLVEWLQAKLFLYEYNPSVKEYIIYNNPQKRRIVCEHVEGYVQEELDILNYREGVLWGLNQIRFKKKDAVIQILNYSIQGCVELCREIVASYTDLPEYEEDFFLLSKKQGYSATLTELKAFLSKGVAFHHAGLPKKIRNMIENRLEQGKIKILVSTSTLSHGVHYKIDGLIISEYPIDYFDKISYSQFKGRIIRPGQDSMQKVYIIPSRLRRAESLKKIILGSYPSVREKIEENIKKLRKDEIITSILSELKDKRYGTSRKVLKAKIQEKYDSIILKRVKLRTVDILDELLVEKFIEKAQKKLKITEEGKSLLEWNFPYESYPYFVNLKNRIKHEKKITTAIKNEITNGITQIAKIQLDVWKERRLNQFSKKEIKKVLTQWMDEFSYAMILENLRENRENLRENREKKHREDDHNMFDISEFLGPPPLYDADIDRLSELVSYIMYKMLYLLKKEEILDKREIINELEILRKSCRFGLKRDLALSNLNLLDLTRGEKITLRKILCKYPNDQTPSIGMLIERSLYKSSDFYRDLIILFSENRFQELLNHAKEIKTQKNWCNLVREEIILSKSNKSL